MATVESVIVFGSAARGTSDSLSDKDVMVVCSEPQRRRELARLWSDDGWSVASYTPGRIQAMIRKGSLFIQHLRREGLMVSDNRSWLRKTLDSAEPKTSYRYDFQSSMQLLRPVSRLKAGYWQQMMAADVSYIFVRNAGIYLLADRGLFEFDYEQIIYRLADIARLSFNQVEILKELRRLKVAYRQRQHSVIDLVDPYALRDVCLTVCNIDEGTIAGNESNVRGVPLRYAMLRDIEARLVARFDIHELDRGRYGKELAFAWKMIRQPREYSWKVRTMDINWLHRIRTILSEDRLYESVVGDLPLYQGLT